MTRSSLFRYALRRPVRPASRDDLAMNRRIPALLAAALSIAAAPPAPAQEAPAGPTLRTGAAEIQLNGRVQTLFNTSSADGVPTTDWSLRRARLDVRVRVNELVSGRVQPEFAGSQVSIVDAFMRLHFDPGFEVLAGRAHRPFSRVEQTSSTRILPVERGLSIRGVEGFDAYRAASALGYSGRDVGLQVMGAPVGAPLGLTYAAGVFRGPTGAAAGAEDSYQLAARATVSPLAALRLGAGWSARDFAATGAGAVALRRGNALQADVEIGSEARGPRLIAELSHGDFDPFADAHFTGAQLWLGYRLGAPTAALSGVEPLLRVSHAEVPDERGGTLLTPGVNLYFGGWNRLMLNLDVWRPAAGDTETSFKALFQLVF